ncbi:phosphopantetheine-binding protein [Nocardiopsis listeri]|uniref:phosphopantetheine-binding protein n=1 Tax=Nocardiopsis listeri TaxID=53440 RepID=UPI0008339968|nr:phosphopantetheine-binding protein [Nocardiopsis listeri]
MTVDDGVLTVIREAVHKAAPAFDGDDETQLITQQVLDSLAVLKVASRLENQLGVPIRDAELLPRNFASISAMRAFLATKGC